MNRDWSDAPYARIYATLSTDPKTAAMWLDDRLLAAYVRLLLNADLAWPMPPAVPRWIADDVLETLAGSRIIETDGTTYQVVGLRAEREGRATGRAVGGKARSDGAKRDENGRYLPDRNAGLAGDAGSLLDQRMLDPSKPARRDETRRDETSIARNGATRERAGVAATQRRINEVAAVPTPVQSFVELMGPRP